mgnify:CR=1 FL=1
MAPATKFYLVSADALPEIFIKVAEAKRMLQSGEVRTAGDAARTYIDPLCHLLPPLRIHDEHLVGGKAAACTGVGRLGRKGESVDTVGRTAR